MDYRKHRCKCGEYEVGYFVCSTEIGYEVKLVERDSSGETLETWEEIEKEKEGVERIVNFLLGPKSELFIP